MAERIGPGQVEVRLRYSRHVGPMFVHGDVTLQFDSFRPYSFVSRAHWPTSNNYETAIREAVEAVLLERQGHLKTTLVVLTQISWDDISSSKIGFRNAATAATRAAFEV
jgi:hypothetical protein